MILQNSHCFLSFHVLQQVFLSSESFPHVLHVILIYGSRWSSPPFLGWVMAPRGPLVQSPLPIIWCNKQTKIFPPENVFDELDVHAIKQKYLPENVCEMLATYCNKQTVLPMPNNMVQQTSKQTNKQSNSQIL